VGEDNEMQSDCIVKYRTKGFKKVGALVEQQRGNKSFVQMQEIPGQARDDSGEAAQNASR
jgi:hypothetical protein